MEYKFFVVLGIEKVEATIDIPEEELMNIPEENREEYIRKNYLLDWIFDQIESGFYLI
ncbi:DUF7167 family protein [Bacillus cereus]|uniref:DUF7167 family protein n=1 Tax=Bacillus cereus TaxID=1396 RepID=UPI0015956947|nr:hypothetical protein [Bacillus cereus]